MDACRNSGGNPETQWRIWALGSSEEGSYSTAGGAFRDLPVAAVGSYEGVRGYPVSARGQSLTSNQVRYGLPKGQLPLDHGQIVTRYKEIVCNNSIQDELFFLSKSKRVMMIVKQRLGCSLVTPEW